MRLTLVQPPNGLYDYYDLAPPLGLLTIAAAVEEDGVDVTLVDMNLQGMRNPKWVGENFYANALQAIAETNPDVVGFTSMVLESHVCLEMARLVKLADSRVITLFGGPHFTSIAREVLELYPWVDYVITGEGELATRSLLRYLQGKLSAADLVNVARRARDSIALTRMLKQDIPTELPFPAYHLVNLSDYFDLNPTRLLDYETGRGCIFRCSFCYSPVHWGQGEQAKQVQRIVEEVVRLHQLGAGHLFFVQDNLLNSKAVAKALCKALAEARTDITWNCYGTLPQLTPDMLDDLANAGCRAVFTGVDAISPDAQRSFAKHFFKGWAHLEERLRACLDRGIVPTCAFMIDIPETNHTNTDAALNTALLARNLGCGIRLNTLTLYNQTASALEKRHIPKTYTELKPRLLLDTPAVVYSNPYAQKHPELFPFHHTFLPLPLYRRFVTGMHIAYTLFTSFPRTLLQYVLADNGSLWQLLEDLGSELGDLTSVSPVMRRPMERELFLQKFSCTSLSQETQSAFALESAELRLGRNDPEKTIPVKTEDQMLLLRSGRYEVIDLYQKPEAFDGATRLPSPQLDPQPYLLVRQGKRIRYFELNEKVARLLNGIDTAPQSGETIQMPHGLLNELLRIGVLRAPQQALGKEVIATSTTAN